MSAKKKARTDRLEAKKTAIAEQQAQFAPETDPVEPAPEEEPVPTEEVIAEKADITETPEMAKAKKPTPRKGQAS